MGSFIEDICIESSINHLDSCNDKDNIVTASSQESTDYGEVISALSNLSIQYNLGVIAPALLLLDHTRGI